LNKISTPTSKDWSEWKREHKGELSTMTKKIIIEMSKTKYYDIEVNVDLGEAEFDNKLREIVEEIENALAHDVSVEMERPDFDLSFDPEDHYGGGCDIEWIGYEVE
jgi:hypothetical protein